MLHQRGVLGIFNFLFAAPRRQGVGRPPRLESYCQAQTWPNWIFDEGLSLAITFVSRGSAHPLTPRCGKEKINYAQNPPLVQHECKISQNRKSKIWDEKWHPIPSPRVDGSMLSLINISFGRISKEMVFAAAMCTFTGQVFCCGYEPFFRCGYEPFFRCGYEPPGRLENLRIKLTQTISRASVRFGLSLAITMLVIYYITFILV